MLILLSPAKKLDFDSENLADSTRAPAFLQEAAPLIERARAMTPADLKRLMGISDALAELNVRRFQAMETPFTAANARPALDAFRGDVYQGLDADSMSADDRTAADKRLRILSGLYGMLRPLDLMQAYRLEMGTKFPNPDGEDLYAFWRPRLADALVADLSDHADRTIVNLASNEYASAVDMDRLRAAGVRVITPVFKEVKDGKARVLAFFAKKARGMMARYAVDGRLVHAEDLKVFDRGGYSFDPDTSGDTEWLFTRPQPPKKG
ncbi:peroxide stress protein YaaA [Yunchengibacter salinarum]|uniref:peroxide stress protein YaaA n=1 Tax=Yunchengibacter salinarum TaxID=3133399 RepID=UPI0035B6707D